jgi:hypothetical protein
MIGARVTISVKCEACPFDDGCNCHWRYVMAMPEAHGSPLAVPLAHVPLDSEDYQPKPCGRLVKVYR